MILALFCLFLPVAAVAESFDNVIQAEIRPGWRMADGTHMAALHMRLAPGWKTYWRAPGDAGIPPQFNWRGASNTTGISVLWPSPEVFWQEGMRSVGYDSDVILPLHVSLRDASADARLRGVIDIGICKDVCLPHRLRVDMTLPASAARPDPAIAAAMADRPISAAEAGVRAVRCKVAPVSGGLSLVTEIDIPGGRGAEAMIETADPQVWVAEPKTRWSGNTLIAETQMRHVNGGVFALDRSGVRITVLRARDAVDIRGCSG